MVTTSGFVSPEFWAIAGSSGEETLFPFPHRVMGRELFRGADTFGQDSEEETVQWTILLASISQWTRRMFAFSTVKAL
jgi:hypothetical protein